MKMLSAEPLWTLLVALLVFQGLRSGVGDRYRIPTDSMEPTLHGDPSLGDVVFVDKLAGAASRRRGSLVVVHHPEAAGSYMVKRIAASGSDLTACWVDLREGDLWLGPDRQRMAREVKDPLAAMGIVWAEFPRATARLDLCAAEQQAGELRLPALPGELTALAGVPDPSRWIGTARDVDATFIEADGQVAHAGDDQGVWDCGLAVDLCDVQDRVVVALCNRVESVLFVWAPAAGRLELWRDGQCLATTTPAKCTGLASLRCGRLDNQFYALIDEQRAGMLLVPRPAAWDVVAPDLGGPRSHVRLAAIGGATVRRLRILRDLFSFRERIAGMPGETSSWPRFVPPGEWFLLGDNAFDSRDSRHFDGVRASEFVGRPLLVLGPPGARRVLEPWW